MKVKRKIKVVLKKAGPKLETHPSLKYQWDPSQKDEMHPHHQVRARELDAVRCLRGRLHLSIEDVMKEGTITELNALVYMLQGLEALIHYGGETHRDRKKVKR